MPREDDIDVAAAQEREDVAGVEHLVPLAAGPGNRHQVMVADEDAEIGRAGETFLDPAVVLAPALEARFAREELGCKQIGLSLQRLAPGAEQPFAHHHGQDEEVYVVVSGSGQARLDSDVVEVKAWDAVRVAPRMVRTFAAGPDGLEILAFGTHTPDDVKLHQSG